MIITSLVLSRFTKHFGSHPQDLTGIFPRTKQGWVDKLNDQLNFIFNVIHKIKRNLSFCFCFFVELLIILLILTWITYETMQESSSSLSTTQPDCSSNALIALFCFGCNPTAISFGSEATATTCRVANTRCWREYISRVWKKWIIIDHNKDLFTSVPSSMVSRRSLLPFAKFAIPHRLDVGIASLFKPIKWPPFLFSNHTSPLHLRLIWSITQLFWVFTFYLNFLGN